jgi:hypothetical protein
MYAKKFIAIILAVAILGGISIVPLAEASGSNYDVEILGKVDSSIRHNGRNTYIVEVRVRANNGARIQGVGCILAYDASVFDLVTMDGAQTLSEAGVVAETGLSLLPDPPLYDFVPLLPMGWNPLLSVALSSDRNTGYVAMQAYRMNATTAASFVTLQKIRLAFKPGRSLDDVSENSIRFVMISEMGTLGGVSSQLQIFDETSTSYEYGRLSGSNTLPVPVFEIEKGQQTATRYIISATAGTGGSVSGGGTFTSGTSVSLVATPNSGYAFDGWYENSAKIENVGVTYTFTATSNRTLEARFVSNNNGDGNNNNGGTNSGGDSGSGGGTNLGNDTPSSGVPTESNPIPIPPDTTPMITNTANGTEHQITINEDGNIAITAEQLAGTTLPVILRIPYSASGNVNMLVGVKIDGHNTLIPYSVYQNGVIYIMVSEAGTYGIVNNPKTFPDVSGHWATDYIDFVGARALYSGDEKGEFTPNGTMTRAMFAQVLANLERVDLSAYSNSRFNDVPIGRWYTAAVEWVASNNIVSGVGNGRFDPSANITREQMAVMLYNYIKHKNISLPANREIAAFADESSISSWALDAVKVIQASGIISGKPGNLYDPKSSATRAEVATIFARFITVSVAP